MIEAHRRITILIFFFFFFFFLIFLSYSRKPQTYSKSTSSLFYAKFPSSFFYSSSPRFAALPIRAALSGQGT